MWLGLIFLALLWYLQTENVFAEQVWYIWYFLARNTYHAQVYWCRKWVSQFYSLKSWGRARYSSDKNWCSTVVLNHVFGSSGYRFWISILEASGRKGLSGHVGLCLKNCCLVYRNRKQPYFVLNISPPQLVFTTFPWESAPFRWGYPWL